MATTSTAEPTSMSEQLAQLGALLTKHPKLVNGILLEDNCLPVQLALLGRLFMAADSKSVATNSFLSHLSIKDSNYASLIESMAVEIKDKDLYEVLYTYTRGTMIFREVALDVLRAFISCYYVPLLLRTHSLEDLEAKYPLKWQDYFAIKKLTPLQQRQHCILIVVHQKAMDSMDPIGTFDLKPTELKTMLAEFHKELYESKHEYMFAYHYPYARLEALRRLLEVFVAERSIDARPATAYHIVNQRGWLPYIKDNSGYIYTFQPFDHPDLAGYLEHIFLKINTALNEPTLPQPSTKDAPS